MMDNESLPRVERIQSTTPVSNLEAFDMMSRFLAAEKAQQLSLDFAGQSYLASSSQAWNDIRLSCNSLLDENDPRREAVAAWKDESVFEAVEATEAEAAPSSPPEESMVTTPATEKSAKEARRSEKKEKKEAKKIRKEARRKSKGDKKARKESKKRKHEEED
jgi:hypothetical protein